MNQGLEKLNLGVGVGKKFHSEVRFGRWRHLKLSVKADSQGLKVWTPESKSEKSEAWSWITCIAGAGECI